MSTVQQRYLNPHHEYEDIDFVSNYSSRRLKRNITLCALYCALLAVGVISLIHYQDGMLQPLHLANVHKVMHITDPHIDIFFNPEESVPRGGCHACPLAISSSSHSQFSTNLSIICPTEREIMLHIANSKAPKIGSSAQHDYFF